MPILDFIRPKRRGRKPQQPKRETLAFPTMTRFWPRTSSNRYLFKPTPRNLRYFSHSPHARRAINAIKNPVSMLEWEIKPLPDIELNSELKRQIEIATVCFNHPNNDDSFQTFGEQLVEDYLIGAAAAELELGGDGLRPLWMFPVDGLSIQIFPGWNGQENEPRYAQVVGYGTAFGGGVVAELRNNELMYLKPNPSTQTPFGFGPLEIAFNTINNILGVAEFAGNVASNARPSIWIDAGEGVTDNDLATLRSYWINEVEGQGVVPITAMGGGNQRSDEKSKRGVTVQRLYPEGDAGLYILYQEFLVRTLGVCFDLSAQNFNIEADVNRNTSEVADDRDWNHAIKPTARKVASHITRDALHRKLGFSQLMFQFRGLEREDEQANAKTYEIEYKGNAVVPNEYRARRGQPPSQNKFADMTYAEMEIAKAAAQGAKQVLDKNLTGDDDAPAKKGR